MPGHGDGLLAWRDSARSPVSAAVSGRSSVTRMLAVVAHGCGRRMPVDDTSSTVDAVVMVAVVVLHLVGHIVVTGRCRNVTTLAVLFTRRELWVDDVRRPGVHQEGTHGDHQFFHWLRNSHWLVFEEEEEEEFDVSFADRTLRRLHSSFAAGRVAGWCVLWLPESMRTGANNWRGAPPPVGGKGESRDVDRPRPIGEDVCDAVRVGGWERGEWEGEKRKLPDDFAGLSSFFSLSGSQRAFPPTPPSRRRMWSMICSETDSGTCASSVSSSLLTQRPRCACKAKTIEIFEFAAAAAEMID